MTADTNDKVRAVFLAAIMALSMIAMGAAALGSAGASAHINENPDHPDDKTVSTAEDISIDQGMILDDIPRNGSAFYTADPFDDDQPQFDGFFGQAKGISGPHTGLTGLPVQTAAYSDAEQLLDAYPAEPVQTITIAFDIVASDDDDPEETIVVDYDHANDVGLQVDADQTNTYLENNVEGTDLGNNNEVTEATVDNAANEIQITYTNPDNSSVNELSFDVWWETQDAVEGLDVDGMENLDHILRAEGGDLPSAGYYVLEAGATALASGDATTGIVDTEETSSEVDEGLDAQGHADGHDDADDTDALAFHIWEQGDLGQQITILADDTDHEIAIHEVDIVEEDDGDNEWYDLGEEIESTTPSPSQAVTWNAGELGLEDGEQYFVTWDGDTEDAAVLDVEALELEAETPDEVVATDDLEISVESNHGLGDVEAWFWEADDFDVDDPTIGDVIHVSQDEFDGPGATTIRTVPEDTLGDGGEFQAAIVHPESEIAIPTDTFEIVEAEEARVTVDSPTAEDQFARGDIVPIELSYENTDRGTLTLGDRDAHNVEINATIRDTDGSGDATIYVNTFQVGHGYLYGDEENVGPAVDEGDWESRNHGFFTHPDDDGAAIDGEEEGFGAVAHSDMAITGGSQGGAIMSSQYSYDLSVVAGEQPHTEVDQLDDRRQMLLEEPSHGDVELHTAPGAGVNAIDPETTDDIDASFEEGRLTDAAGVIANQDYIMMEVPVEGFTGIFHENILADEEGDVDVDDLFDREDDHLITDIWNLPGDITLTASAEVLNVPENFEEIDFALDADRVISGTDESELNWDGYFIPFQMDVDDIDDLPEDFDVNELPRDVNIDLSVSLTEGLGEGDDTPNPALTQAPSSDQDISWEPAEANIDTENIAYDNVEDRVEVPSAEDVTLPGTTNVAAGTNLTVQTNSKSGQDYAFFDLQTNVFPTHDGDRGTQLWSVVIEDDFAADNAPGTEFDIVIRRQGAAGNINPGSAIEGIILDPPEVFDFELGDKASLGEVIRVNEVHTNAISQVGLYNEDGDQIALSSQLAGNQEHNNVAVTLDQTLDEGEHEITARLYQSDGSQYPGESEDTATIQVGDQEPTLPAAFDVSNLQPGDTTVDEPGDTVDVSATITNDGDDSGEVDVDLLLGDTVEETTTVDLEGGEDTSVEFTLDTSGLEHGETAQYTVDAQDDSESALVTVAEAEEEEDDEEDDVDDEEVDEDDEDDDADDDGAGFGVVVAALALLGAALLAVRRQTE